jgi:hypothetical protein
VSYFKEIQGEHSLIQLFEIGPYNRFDNGRRVELDGSNFSPDNLSEKQRLLNTVLKQVNSLIDEELSSAGFLIVLKFEESTDQMKPSIGKILQEIGIVDFNLIETEIYEDEGNELFNFLFLIEMKGESIQKLIRAFLARHIDLEPYIMAELFFVKNDMSTYANLYDDRGIDFIYLK